MKTFYKIAVKVHEFCSKIDIDIGIAEGNTIDEVDEQSIKLFKEYCDKNNLDTRNYFIDNCLWLEWPGKKYEIELFNISELINKLPKSKQKSELIDYISNIDYNRDRVITYFKHAEKYGYKLNNDYDIITSYDVV